MSRFLLIGWLGWMGCLSLAAQVDIRGRLDSGEWLIGDHLRLEYTIAHDPDVEVLRAELPLADSAEVEVLEESPLLRVHDSLVQKRYVLTAFDSGVYRVPGLRVAWKRGANEQTTAGPDLSFEMATLPVPADSAVLQPIKPIISEPLRAEDLIPFLVVLGLLAAIGLVAWWVSRVRKREKELPPPPPILRPAHELALADLRKLEEEKAWETDSAKRFYVRSTYILRKYIERRFGLEALESTTDELLLRLNSREEPEETLRRELRIMLQEADLVKFAKMEPEPAVRRTLLERMANWIKATADAGVRVPLLPNEETTS